MSCENEQIYKYGREMENEPSKKSYLDSTNGTNFDDLYQIYAQESDLEVSELVDSSDSEDEADAPRGCESEDDEPASGEKYTNNDGMIADLMAIKKRWARNRGRYLHLEKKDDNANIDAINKLKKEHVHLRRSFKTRHA